MSMPLAKIRNALRVTRLPFLVLTPTSVLLGYAAASVHMPESSGALALLVLVGALTAHVSVNAFNEHHDFITGIDLHTARTPFSGGSGALPAHPELAWAALSIAAGALCVTAAIGLYMVTLRGLPLLLIGVLGVALVVTYTPLLCRHALLCLFAPGIGFGPLIVLGTVVVLTGTLNPTALVLSLVPLFLVSNVLLLNQFPDVAADRRAGRRNLPIVFGALPSLAVYVLFLLLALSAVAAGVLTGVLPDAALLAVTILPVGLIVAWRAHRCFEESAELVPLLAMNVALAVITPLLLAATILFA